MASILQGNILRRAIKQPSLSHNTFYIKHSKYNKKSYNKPRSTHPSTNSKFYSRTSKFNDSRDHNKSRFLKSFCKNCQRSGHETKYCFRNSNNKGKITYKEYQSYNASHDDYDQNNNICNSDQNSDEDNEDSFIAFMALTLFNHSSTSMWIHTGATCHLTSRVEWLKDYKPLEHPFPMRFGNNGV